MKITCIWLLFSSSSSSSFPSSSLLCLYLIAPLALEQYENSYAFSFNQQTKMTNKNHECATQTCVTIKANQIKTNATMKIKQINEKEAKKKNCAKRRGKKMEKLLSDWKRFQWWQNNCSWRPNFIPLTSHQFNKNSIVTVDGERWDESNLVHEFLIILGGNFLIR